MLYCDNGLGEGIMCDAGQPGHEVYVMTQQEVLHSLVRLCLTGQLDEAIREYKWGYFGGFLAILVPYYDWNPEIKEEELLPQISLQAFVNQDVTLWAKFLPILIERLEEKEKVKAGIKTERPPRFWDTG